jgi:hypothetical protein
MNIGQFDQMIEGIKDLAKATKVHYDNLIKSGFNQQEALWLSSEFQKNIMNGNK